MLTYLNHRGVELALLLSAFFVVALFIPGDAVACFEGGVCMEDKVLPGPAAGGLAVAAIIGTLVIAKMRRRK